MARQGHLPRAERWALALAVRIARAGISLGLRPAIRDACFAARAGQWRALVWTRPRSASRNRISSGRRTR